ncbi:carbohydrate ABC transporter permease [Paenibacillus chungangensis]|uniref:Carbohydrate ABC transporter permease n=1 Tax=Paenibacillus chungangensis TaxID=696535 RepID=A0ABW3HQ82_9BACL
MKSNQVEVTIRDKGFGNALFDVINITGMCLLVALTAYPFIYILFASLSEPNALMGHSGLLFKPLGFNPESYKRVLENPIILSGYANTIFVLVIGLAVNLSLTIVGAYVLSRRGLYWRNAIMFFVVFTMFFTGGLIPIYLTVKGIGLLDSRFALILPVAINTFHLIIMRTSFQSIPHELEESARMDGAGDLRLLFRIIVPLSMPVISVMILFYGVQHWNSWFNAMIYLRDRDLFPLQLVLREILIANDASRMIGSVPQGDEASVAATIKYAAIIITTVPILFIYPFLQRYFVSGVMIGALKE